MARLFSGLVLAVVLAVLASSSLVQAGAPAGKSGPPLDISVMAFKEFGLWYDLCTAPVYLCRIPPQYLTYGPPPPQYCPPPCYPVPKPRKAPNAR